MATDTVTLEQDLKEKKRLAKLAKQLHANRELDYGIRNHDDEHVRIALANGAQVSTLVVHRNGEIDDRLPLLKAVLVGNIYAVNQLLAQGANPNILDFDVPLMDRAIEKGNTQIVTALLTAKCDVNSYAKRSALDAAITELADHALVNAFDSIWDNDTTDKKLKKELQSWFITPSQQAPDSPLPLRVKFFGNIEMIKLLFSYDVNASRPNLHDVSPEMIVQNPQNYVEEFTRTFEEGPEDNVTYLGLVEKGSVLSFQRNLYDRSLTKTLPIIVDYDLSQIKPILQEYLVLKAQARGVSRESIVRRFEESEKKAAAEKATIAPMLKIHQAAETRKEKIKSLHTAVATSTLNSTGINPVGAFYDTFTRELNNILLAFKVLASGAVQRTKNTKLDKATTIINMLAEHVPFGSSLKLIGALTDAISDHIESKRHKRVMSVVDLDHTSFCQDLALEIINGRRLTPDSDPDLALLTPTNAENMAKKALAIVLTTMNDETFEPKAVPVEKQLSTAVNTSPYFKTELERYRVEQEVIKKPLAKAVTKGFSRLCKAFT